MATTIRINAYTPAGAIRQARRALRAIDPTRSLRNPVVTRTVAVSDLDLPYAQVERDDHVGQRNVTYIVRFS